MKTCIWKQVVLGSCAALFAGSAWAAGIVAGPCGGGPFGGMSTGLFACAFADGTSASYGATDVDAGVDFFHQYTSPVSVVSTLPGAERTVVIDITSTPTWTTATVPTFLRLDGTVTIDVGFVDLLFEGFLGGVLVNSVKASFDTPGVHALGIPDFNPAAPTGTPALSRLTVTVHSIARYDAGSSPTFTGAVPEPSALVLLGVGLIIMLMGMRVSGFVRR